MRRRLETETANATLRSRRMRASASESSVPATMQLLVERHVGKVPPNSEHSDRVTCWWRPR